MVAPTMYLFNFLSGWGLGGAQPLRKLLSTINFQKSRIVYVLSCF